MARSAFAPERMGALLKRRRQAEEAALGDSGGVEALIDERLERHRLAGWPVDIDGSSVEAGPSDRALMRLADAIEGRDLLGPMGTRWLGGALGVAAAAVLAPGWSAVLPWGFAAGVMIAGLVIRWRGR